jgi:hypothetical protein
MRPTEKGQKYVFVLFLESEGIEKLNKHNLPKIIRIAKSPIFFVECKKSMRKGLLYSLLYLRSLHLRATVAPKKRSLLLRTSRY